VSTSTARTLLPGALAGLLAAAAALGVAELLASFVSTNASPLISVGGTFVDATPRWLKEFAIRTFGERDKTVLLLGIAVTITGLSMAIGVLARYRLRLGLAAVVLLGLIPAVAATTRPTGSWVDALPGLVGALVGAAALAYLVRSMGTAFTPEAPVSPPTIARRTFLQASLVVGGVAAVSGVLGRFVLGDRLDVEKLRAALRLPSPAEPAATLPASAQVNLKGVSPYFTPNSDFYRVDTALVVPAVNSDDWSLRIHGMVDRELSISLEDLLSRPLIERDITLTCVSNEVGGPLLGTARWLGVRVQDLLEEAGVASGADQVVSRSSDGMTIGTPTTALMDGRDALLAVGMNGEPLPLSHGYPVRMVVPGLYGYVSACKWIVEMEATTFGAYDPYWVDRGWDAEAPIKTSSRIDTPKPLARIDGGDVVVGGVAWAQTRGVSSVEVRVDGGDWSSAQLAASGGIDTWRQWSWNWSNAPSGNHTLEVRATDRDGMTQGEERKPPFPNGSTGWHSVVVSVN
jgi:DMSO/TMAO reductase YedYZ molybdopterin-dependent catalytic subunit